MSSTENNASASDGTKKMNGWLTYFQENTLKVAWSSLLLLGGLFILIYFEHIGFLPDVDLQNIVSLLASVAMVGAFFVFVLLAIFVAPGLFLHYLVSTNLLASLDLTMTDLEADDSGNAKASTLKVEARKENRALVLASIVASVFSAGIQVAVLWVSGLKRLWRPFSWLNTFQPHLYEGLFILALILLAGALIILYRYRNFLQDKCEAEGKDGSKEESKARPRLRKLAIYIALGCLWIVVGAIPMLPFVLAYRGPDGYGSWYYLLLWLIWIGLSNSLWGCSRGNIKWPAVGVIGLVSLYFFIITASNPSIVSSSTVRALGLGSIQNVSLVVKKEACQAIEQTIGQGACIEGKNGPPFITEKVNLLSRIGSQYLIEATDAHGGKVRLVLDKKDVVGWATTETRRIK